MLKGSFIAHAVLLFVLQLVPMSAGAQEQYELVWSDEFTEDGTPDSARWNYEQGFVRNREWQWYQPQNARVHDGVLSLTARLEQKQSPWYNPSATDWQHKRDSIECTSACVTTYGRRTFLYGRFEVRARIPEARGVWPAIWFLGTNRNVDEERRPWPYCGEIDLMEYYPKGGQPALHANACWGGKDGHSVWNSRAVPLDHFKARDERWLSQFHVWRMDWTPAAIRLYIDDELINDISTEHTINAAHGGENPFQKPMYILLNLAMGSSGGKVDKSTLPLSFDIDYVRVYQLKE